MRPSEDCVELIKRLEGFRARPYLCSAGRPTIGYGSRFYADGRRVTLDDAPIAEPAAVALLRATVAKVWGSVQGMVGRPLLQRQCDALTMLVYNIGETQFRESTMLRLLRAGKDAEAAAEFPKWNKETVAGGKRPNAGLTARRRLERRIFEKG